MSRSKTFDYSVITMFAEKGAIDTWCIKEGNPNDRLQINYNRS